MKINHEEMKNTKGFFYSLFVSFVSSWLIFRRGKKITEETGGPLNWLRLFRLFRNLLHLFPE